MPAATNTNSRVVFRNFLVYLAFVFYLSGCAESGSDSGPGSDEFGGARSVDNNGDIVAGIVVEVGDEWRYRKGTSSPSSDWNSVGFDDATWLAGSTGIGYGDGDDTTILSDMSGNYATVYTRKIINYDGGFILNNLSLEIDYDDGFVAYINGQEVARANMPVGQASFDTLANANRDAGAPVLINLDGFINLIGVGDNVLAIEIHNSSLNSSDLSFLPRLLVNMGESPPPTNAPPLVSAGVDQAITLPAGAVLNATVNDDNLPIPTTLTTTWSQVSGPGVVSFGDATAVDTTATFSTAGSYVLRLTANDGALVATDEMTVVVSPTAPNSPPVVSAGADQAITLPAGAALNATVSDDNLPIPTTLTTTWSQVSGPGVVSFADATAVDTTATFSTAGSYVLRLTANDGALVATDEMTVVASPVPPNSPPVVSAGADQAITLPAGAALNATVSDDNLPIPTTLTTTWSQVSGPGVVNFGDATAVDTTATFSTAGSYVLRLTANDGALVATDEMTVVVSPAPPNSPPVVSAGADQAITLPAGAALNATVSDDNLPIPTTLTTTWSQVSGPGVVNFGDATAVDTTATFSTAGSYVLRLTANDGALVATDEMTVVVSPEPPNSPPVVSAGADQAITLPAGAALNATVSDDNLPIPTTLTTTWSQVSGPGVVNFGDATAVDTTATFSTAGSYVLRLTANDGALVATDEMTVVVSPSSGGALRAFPGAEGYGAETVGGRGGQVIKVTNLNDSGPGSLREAVNASGSRIVVFEVSGIINLQSNLNIDDPYITIAGQTSPGGILVAGKSTTINTHDVIIRYVRFRAGSHNASDPGQHDTIQVLGQYYASNEAYNIIFDHCSISWGIDETMGISGGVTNMTVQWSIVSEGLRNAGHPEGEHSKGLMISGKYIYDTTVSLHHNYIAHNVDRNPLILSPSNQHTRVDVVNNVVYNWKGGLSAHASGDPEVNWVHNYAKQGANSNDYSYEVTGNESSSPQELFYVEGNIGSTRLSQNDPHWNVGNFYQNDPLSTAWRKDQPWDAPPVTTNQMSHSYALQILQTVGASLPVRDSVDTRIIDDFANLTGGHIDDVTYPDDFPTFANPAAPQDSDDDGMPDSWELANSLNTNSDDSALDADGDGYTNIEEYLHSLAW